MGLAPIAPVRSLKSATRQAQLKAARTCYDHLAGQLGTALTDAMVDRGWLTFDATYDVLALTPDGARQAQAWGWAMDLHHRTPLVRPCLDWSERRYHVAGQVGRSLAQWMFAQEWIVRGTAPRVVLVTEDGRHALETWFGLSWPLSERVSGEQPVSGR